MAVVFKFSHKLILSFLAIIFFVGSASTYTHQQELASRNELIDNMEILRSSERIALFNARVLSASQRFFIYDAEYEHVRAMEMFSEAYEGLNAQISILEKSGADKYSLGILKTYLLISKSDFEKLEAHNDTKQIGNSSSALIMGKEKRDVLKSIEDSNVKITGAREMIVAQANKKQADSLVKMRTQEQLSTILLTLAILFGIILSVVITRAFTKQITDLCDSAKKIGQGNMEIKMNISSHDEIGELAASFNQMATDLKKSHGEALVRAKEAEEAKKELEGKVAELERFNKLSVGRELRMIELKKKLAETEGNRKEK